MPTKTCLYVFLAAIKFSCILKHVSIPFFATVGFLRLLKYVSMSLLWCRMVGRIALLWCEVNGGSNIIGHDLRRSQLPWLVTVA